MTEQSIDIPAYTAVAVTVDRNRATQLVVPGQRVLLIGMEPTLGSSSTTAAERSVSSRALAVSMKASSR